MTETEILPATVASLEEIQQGWHDLRLRIRQLEAEKAVVEQDNKSLRFKLETLIEHRQKSHSELIVLLTTLVTKLPINDVGVIVSKLVEHQTNVSTFLGALAKGSADTPLPTPKVLQTLDDTKRDLLEALKPLIEELIRLDVPMDKDQLQALLTDPEQFFSPRMVRANRCFVKGQIPRERIVRDFGEPALAFFNDLTTDPKLNPSPKPDEIMLAFKPDFEALFQQQPALIPEKRQDLMALYQKVQRSKGPAPEARSQKIAFAKLSFIIELLHYYDHQNTEAPDVIFAQRLPAVVEQLVISGPQETLEESLLVQAENLITFVINPDHRLMIVNNIGKGGGIAKNLKYLLRLRAEKLAEADQVAAEFVKHLIPPPPQKPPTAEQITTHLRLLRPEMQRVVAIAVMTTDRLRRPDAEALGKAVGAALDLKGLELQLKAPELPPEMERQMAWGRIKELITGRNEPASIASAIRERLHAKYDAEEIKQSWITLIEADALALIRIFCQLPYLPSGKTDPIAKTVMETYISRLTHEKYAAAYSKVMNSLKNMFKAKPDSPTLLNFMALVKWVDPDAANKLSHDIGMPVSP